MTTRHDVQKPRGLYLHLPYCLRKCPYCDFYSLPQKPSPDFLPALKRELQAWAEFEPPVPLETVYFGGGTPTVFPTKGLIGLLEETRRLFGLAPGAEVTLEMNPECLAWQDMRALREAGFNRLSLGLQTTDDAKLRQLGRLHAYEGFLECYEAARAAGFHNISLDLIVALPHQGMEDVETDLNRILALAPLPEHVSVYSLIVEEGTPFGRVYQPGVAPLPDPATEREMVGRVTERLREEGYVHYEISSYAKPGRGSRHNLLYWDIEPYYAAGPGASAFVGNKRYGHPQDLATYLELWREPGNLEAKLSLEEELSLEDRATEYAVFRLRRLDLGIDLREYERRFGAFPEWRREILERYRAMELVERVPWGYRLTENGADFADAVARDLL